MYFKAAAGIMGLSRMNCYRVEVAIRTKGLAWAGPFALCMALLIGCNALPEATLGSTSSLLMHGAWSIPQPGMSMQLVLIRALWRCAETTVVIGMR